MSDAESQDGRIDLEALKSAAASTDGDRTVVSRVWLQQVATELTAGRIAQAQINRARSMDDVIQDLRTGPIERTSTL